MRKAVKALALLPLLALLCWSAFAQTNPGTVQFTSLRNDYTVSVPEGWKSSYDEEGSHYSETTFKGGCAYCSISVRWYTRYATHRTPDAGLEMYAGADSFIQQLSDWYRDHGSAQPASEVSVGSEKGQQVVGHLVKSELAAHGKYWRPGDDDDRVLSRQAWLGKLVGAEVARAGGRQAWAVMSTSSGNYVFAYFAPEEDFAKYERLYNELLASFTLLKDGPAGSPFHRKEESSANQLRRYVTLISGDREPACELIFTSEGRQTVCHLFGTNQVRREIIEFVLKLDPAPAIPEDAMRLFVQGNVFMQSKDPSDCKLAVSKYREAVNMAPWWGDAYNNLAIALNLAGQPDFAKEAMELYLLTKPKDAARAQAKIYEFEAQKELAETRKHREDEAMKAKYGGNYQFSSWEVMYRYGGVIQDMRFDASSAPRTICLKLMTRKESGYLRSYFSIADITRQDDTFNQEFSMDWRGTRTLYLDDRTTPNKEFLTFEVTTFGDDAKIRIAPASSASASIETTLTELLRERARQAIYLGNNDVKVGEKLFFVLPQGGPSGALLYFPAEMKDKVEHGPARDLMPMFVATTVSLTNGRKLRFSNTDLGILDGTPYHLEFTGSYWAVKPGRGEQH